jgi:hypothetical protein
MGRLVLENDEDDGVDRRRFKHRFTKRGEYPDYCSRRPKTTGALAVLE